MGRLANWLVLPTVLASWEFNFGNFGPGEEIVIFSDVLQKQGDQELALWDTTLSPNEANLVPLSCRKIRQLTFENSAEPLPITRSGYNYMACYARRALPHLTAYGLACRETAGQWRFDATETIVYDANQPPRERYEDTIQQSLNAALSVDRSIFNNVNMTLKAPLSPNDPWVAGVTPNVGSPNGGLLVTIYGDNLYSKKITLGGEVSESDKEGEDYRIWFSRTDNFGGYHEVECIVDRMLMLHAQPLNGQDFVVCKTQPMPRHTNFDLKVQIDNGAVLKAGKVDFIAANAPTVSEFYPGASAAAVPRDEWDYEGEFFTRWFNVDDNSDGVEDESFIKHFTADRAAFQHCAAPIDIEVRDMEKLRMFENSAAENVDGLPSATYMNAEQGFLCNNTMQSLPGITCPNTQVRYRCLPNVQMIKGRIFTQVHGRMDHEDFHINRIHEQPKLEDEQDGFKSEAVMFLNDGVDCGDHPNCGKNSRLTLKTISGNNGVMAFKPKASIPGAYNFTYETLHQGRSMVKKRYMNFLNEQLNPSNFEVYPSIKGVSPQQGPLEGGTLITIDGTGFITDGLGGAVTVSVGDTSCLIKSISETQIVCETMAHTDTRQTATFSESRLSQIVVRQGKIPSNEPKFSLALAADECQAACLRDYTCVVFISSGTTCQIFDWVDAWLDSTGDLSHVIPQSDQKSCFTGRGETYTGSLATTKNGYSCVSGTFCRNENPAKFMQPNCVQAYNNKRAKCNVRPCGDMRQYAGNRGVNTAVHYGLTFNRDIRHQASPALFTDSFTSPAYHISASRDNFFFGQDGGADFYLARSEAFFVAPMDGFYSFNLVADQHAEFSFGKSTESFDELNTHGNSNPGVLDSSMGEFSAPIYMTKNEQMLLETVLSETKDDDFLTVGVVYHGKDQSGTRHDHRDYRNYPVDSYINHRQVIDVRQDGADRNHAITIMTVHDRPSLEAGVGFSSGQWWDKARGIEFVLKQCGDDSNCFFTETIDPIVTKRTQVEDKIEKEWLKTECTYGGKMQPQLYYATFEDGVEGEYGQRNDQGVYCGRFAWRVVQDKIWSYKWGGNSKRGTKATTSDATDLCLAYKGKISRMSVYGSYVRKSDQQVVTGEIKFDMNLQSTTWTHTCIDLRGELLKVATDRKGEIYDMETVTAWNADGEQIWIDELRLGKTKKTITIAQTRKALTFNGKMPSAVDVSWQWDRGTGLVFTLVWVTKMFDDLDWMPTLPEIIIPTVNTDLSVGGTTTGNDWRKEKNFIDVNNVLTGLEADLLGGEPLDYSISSIDYVTPDNHRHVGQCYVLRSSVANTNLKVDATLTMDGKPGSVDVTFDGSHTKETLRKALVSEWSFLSNKQPGDFDIEVEKWGSSNSGYSYSVTARNHGYMPKFNISYKIKSANNLRTVVRVRDARVPGVFTPLIPGSALATVHNQPQVVVTANGQRSACHIDSCAFNWSSDLQLAITSVTPAAGAIEISDTIEIALNTGSYMGSFADAKFRLGDSVLDCKLKKSVAKCTVGEVPIGNNHIVTVSISSLGEAKMQTTLFTSTSLGSQAPLVGSKYGGTFVTAHGSGFVVGHVVQVQVHGQTTDCTVVAESTYNQLLCETQSNNAIPDTSTPHVTSLSVRHLNVAGNELVTIAGNKFAGTCGDNSVIVGNQKQPIVSWTNNEIVFRTKNLQIGSLNLVVFVCGVGYSNSITTTVEFKITGLVGANQSLLGGRPLTIKGSGFSSGVSVDIGSTACPVKSVQSNEIVCEPYSVIKTVKLGLGPRGFVYSSDQSSADEVTIYQGDVISWSWSFGQAAKVRLQEVSSLDQHKGDNKWSKEFDVATARFTKRFEQAGTFYYSTGKIDDSGLFYTGTIVVKIATDIKQKVNVVVDGKSALQSTPQTVTFSWKSTATVTSYSIADPLSFGFKSDSLVTVDLANADGQNAVVSFISSRSEVSCAGIVNNGRVSCLLGGENAAVNIDYRLQVRVDSGHAYYDNQVYSTSDKDYKHDFVQFAAYADNIQPNQISRYGDAVITITGGGFSTNSIIRFSHSSGQQIPCSMISATYYSFECKLAKFSASIASKDRTFVGTATENGIDNELQATFGTSSLATPSLKGVTPTVITAASTLVTITGDNLSNIAVTIAGEDCVQLASTTSTAYHCHAPSLVPGYHNVRATGALGAVENKDNLRIASRLQVGSVQPSTVGEAGGSLVTVSGNGFDENTVVQVVSNQGEMLCEFCHKVNVTPSQFVFIAPVGAVGGATLSIYHEFLASDNKFTMSLTYATSASIVSANLSSLQGGETVSIQGADSKRPFDCATAKAEVYLATDPCAVGAHTCHNRAECTASNDRLSYSCECHEGLYGDGKACYHFEYYFGARALFEDGKTMCQKKAAGWTNVDVDSPLKEQWLAEWFGDRKSRELYIKWYGKWSCVKFKPNTKSWRVDGDTAEECDVIGESKFKFKKGFICQVGIQYQRNCIDDQGDENVGKENYRGWLTHTVTGVPCLDWSTNDKDYKTNHADYSNRNNFCTSIGSRKFLGPYCPTEYFKDGDRVFASCGVPYCKELAEPAKRHCTIASSGDGTRNDRACYLGNFNMHDIAVNPRSCADNTAYGILFSILEVSGKAGVYQIATQVYKSGKNPTYLYANVNEMLVYGETMKNIRNVQDTYWTMQYDEFGDGTVSFKNGKYYMRAHTPKEYRTNGKFIELIHEDDLTGTEQSSLAWNLKCRSDDYGALIPQPEPTYAKTADVPIDHCTGSSISLSTNALPAGSYQLAISSSLGRALGSMKLDFELALHSATPTKISATGGTLLTITGAGFSKDTTAQMCGVELEFAQIVSTREIIFRTVPFVVDNNGGCSKGLVLQSINKATGNIMTTSSSRSRRSINLTVDVTKAPQVTALEPTMGGTAGGTKLTLSGSGFGTDISEVDVTIHGSTCTVESVTDNTVVCETGTFPRHLQQTPIEPVVLVGGGGGFAEVSAQFWYIDKWSSSYTWGCVDDSCKPVAGDIVHIKSGQVILLDESTPVLKLLLIDGGKMIWARKDGVELHMEYGVVNNNGSFEIGSEDEPFCSGSALIKMYGHQRSVNLPIYGAKVFAVRFGTLDIHGCPVTTTWSELDGTVYPGDAEIAVTHVVENDWHVGDEIVVAATGDITAWERSEKRKITAISGSRITLDRPLKYQHLGVCQNGPNNNGLGWGWAGELCMRAEVGLLTRNVKMTGNLNHVEQVETARFEHETGSDQFGSVLFIHKVSHAKLAHFEVTHAGQAFNLARYPIHFHTPGSLPTSYVRGCAIHNTFNRALTLHGIHDILVEYNVGYNVMGLMFFLEDAVEENNILRYNLGILNKKSAALLNVDVTPSVFWIPNPNNVFYGNRAVGSSHFGFWFNPPTHPTGPAAKDPKYNNFCVTRRPLGGFYNNTAHSLGGYGFWVFKELSPNQSGECGDDSIKAMKFGLVPENDPVSSEPIANREQVPGFFAWHCTRGAEITIGGAMHFTNFIAANNWISGLAWRESRIRNSIMPGNTAQEEVASMYKRSIVIGHFGGAPELDACGDIGIETPWEKEGFAVHDISFYNFDEQTPKLMSDSTAEHISGFGQGHFRPTARRCVAIDPCYFTTPSDCGVTTYYSDVKWYNSQRRVTFSWEHEAAMWDIDGTFMRRGKDKYLVARSDHFDPTFCSAEESGMYDLNGNAPHPASFCHGQRNGQKFSLHKFAFNRMLPLSTIGAMVRMKSPHGETISPYRNCRPMNKGYMMLLQGNQEYVMSVDHHEHVSNVTYRGVVRGLKKDDWIVVRHDIPDQIDNTQIETTYTDIGEGTQEEIWDLPAHTHFPIGVTSWPTDGAFMPYLYQVKTTKPYMVRYALSGLMNDANEPNAIPWTAGVNMYFKPNFYKCFYPNCQAPKPVPPTPPPSMTTCEFSTCGIVYTPGANYNVPSDKHVIIDRVTLMANNFHLKFSTVFVDGTLELKSSALLAGETLLIEVDSILVNVGADLTTSRRRRDASSIMAIPNGQFILGTASDPINCDAKVIIKLPTYADSKSYANLPDSIPLGRKVIGGYGAIKMHGCVRTSHAFVDVTVNNGDNTIQLDRIVNDWSIGDKLAIGSTDWYHYHTEYATIQSISGKTVTLDRALDHRHLGKAATSKQLLGREYHQGAEVALLTRNIVIDGNAGSEKMGGRTMVAGYSETIDGNTYVRAGSGQFSGVEFKDYGQFGHEGYDDYRSAVLFYETPGTANATLSRDESYVRGCAFSRGFNGAIATISNSDDIMVSDNIIFNGISSGIWTDSVGTIIDGNVIGHLHQQQLSDPTYAQATDGVVSTLGNNAMANGIDWQGATDPIITNNRVGGTEGSCFYGPGEECDHSEACSGPSSTSNRISGNVAHSCWRGVHVLRKGNTSSCQRFNGFTVYKCLHFGFYSHLVRVQSVIVESTIVADSRVGITAQVIGDMNTEKTRDLTQYSFTVKNSAILGRDYGTTWDCGYDEPLRHKHNGVLLDRRQRPPVDDSCLAHMVGKPCPRTNEHIGLVFPEYLTTDSKFPNEPYWDTEGAPVMFARTCLHQVQFDSYKGSCPNSQDYAMSTQAGHDDHVFRVELNDVSCTNCNANTKLRIHRPDDSSTDPGHCAGMHCDGTKSTVVVDHTGHFFGRAGTLSGEVEFGWTGIKRGSNPPYNNPMAGLSDDKIPMPLRFDRNNKPYSTYYSDVGVYRNNKCNYEDNDSHGWFCPTQTGNYFDVTFESMDNDFLTRKLTPLAVRSGGYLFLVNGPADHSTCIGYGCNFREMILHSTMACNREYDYYLSSTFPLHSRFHIPYAPADCLIKLNIYNKRPNRIDAHVNGALVTANNAVSDGKGGLTWKKSDSSFIPTLASPLGANYHDKRAQVVHLIIGGGENTFELKTVQSLIVEFGVVTEMTEDDIYDNGNMANNLAVVLGVSPDRIKIMEVISESSSARRRRSLANGWTVVTARNRRSTTSSSNQKTLRVEILPEVNSNFGAEELDDIAANIVNDPAMATEAVTEALQESDPTVALEADLAVATPPKDIEPVVEESIIDKLQLEDQQEEESDADFLARVEEALGAKLADFDTAESRSTKAQVIADEASSLKVYKNPTTLVLDTQPNGEQLIDANLNSIRLHMLDQDGKFMETVGYNNRPYQVKAEMVDMVTNGASPTSINGKTVVDFEAGNGYAAFNNLVFSGDLVSARIQFSIKDPQPNKIAPVLSEVITFLKPIISIEEAAELDDNSSCPLNEAALFNRQAAFTDGCTRVCLTSCNDLSFLGVESVIECNAVSTCEGSPERPTHATCGNQGCVCDEILPPLSQLNPADYMFVAACTTSTVEFRANKCVLNKAGFYLDDLYVNGVERAETEADLVSGCRGHLAYDNGPEYVFTVDRNQSECLATISEGADGQQWWRNGLQGFVALERDDDGNVTKKRQTVIKFGCPIQN